MGTKETNPKDAFGSQKVGLSCVPMTVVLELATAMREGAQKYGRYNWRESGVRSSVYFDAAIRHLFAWWEGEEIDPDSGISHITKAITSLTVLRDSQMQSETQPELFNDDRPVNHVKHLVTKMNTKISDPTVRFREISVEEAVGSQIHFSETDEYAAILNDLAKLPGEEQREVYRIMEAYVYKRPFDELMRKSFAELVWRIQNFVDCLEPGDATYFVCVLDQLTALKETVLEPVGVTFPGPATPVGITFASAEDVEKRRLSIKEIKDQITEQVKKEVLEEFRKDRDKSILTPGFSGTTAGYNPAGVAINYSAASLTDAQLKEKIGSRKWWLVDSEYLKIRGELSGLSHKFIAQIASALYSLVFVRCAAIRIWSEDVRALYNRLVVFITPLTEDQAGEVIRDLDQIANWKREEQKKQEQAVGPQTSLASSAQFRYISQLIHRTNMEAALQLREAFQNYENGGFFFRNRENLPSVTLIMHKIADHAKELPSDRVRDMFKAFAKDVEIRIETLKSYEDPLNCNSFKHIKNELLSHIDEWRREALVGFLRGESIKFEDGLEADWCEKVRLFLADLTEENRELCLPELQRVAVGPQNPLNPDEAYSKLQAALLALPQTDALLFLGGLESELQTGVPYMPARYEHKTFYQQLISFFRRVSLQSRDFYLTSLHNALRDLHKSNQ